MSETEILNIIADWNYWGNFREQLRARPDYLARMEQLFSNELIKIRFKKDSEPQYTTFPSSTTSSSSFSAPSLWC